jgi:hypothetical protein
VKRIGVILLVVGLFQGCKAETVACTPSMETGLLVDVLDAGTGQPICDAVVTAIDGSYSERLDTHGGCQYLGAFERAGHYDVLAEREGFQSQRASNVEVRMGTSGCHVVRTDLTIQLVRGPQGAWRPGLHAKSGLTTGCS